jgi:hypothetical protein
VPAMHRTDSRYSWALLGPAGTVAVATVPTTPVAPQQQYLGLGLLSPLSQGWSCLGLKSPPSIKVQPQCVLGIIEEVLNRRLLPSSWAEAPVPACNQIHISIISEDLKHAHSKHFLSNASQNNAEAFF